MFAFGCISFFFHSALTDQIKRDKIEPKGAGTNWAAEAVAVQHRNFDRQH